jgi:hypothetical protein
MHAQVDPQAWHWRHSHAADATLLHYGKGAYCTRGIIIIIIIIIIITIIIIIIIRACRCGLVCVLTFVASWSCYGVLVVVAAVLSNASWVWGQGQGVGGPYAPLLGIGDDALRMGHDQDEDCEVAMAYYGSVGTWVADRSVGTGVQCMAWRPTCLLPAPSVWSGDGRKGSIAH